MLPSSHTPRTVHGERLEDQAPQRVLLLQRLQVPAEAGGIADELARRHGTYHDDARLLIRRHPPLDALHAYQSLARSWRAFHQDHIALENPAQEEGIRAGDPCLDALMFRHGSPPARPDIPATLLLWLDLRSSHRHRWARSSR